MYFEGTLVEMDLVDSDSPSPNTTDDEDSVPAKLPSKPRLG
jgi:hypothetical protein